MTTETPAFVSTAQVMDLLVQGKLRNSIQDSSVGRLLAEAAIYHEGLWYKVSVHPTDLEDVKATFGDNGQQDNIRDPERPTRLLSERENR